MKLHMRSAQLFTMIVWLLHTFNLFLFLGKGSKTIFALAEKKTTYTYSYQQGSRNDPVSNTRPVSTSTCGKNERFTTCASSTCFEESCGDALYPKLGPVMCTKDCRQGCQCVPGFYRSREGRCVDSLSCSIMEGYGDGDGGSPALIDNVSSITSQQKEGIYDDNDDDDLHVPTKSDTSPVPPCSSENERYTTCASSTCFEETCADVLYPELGPKKCTKDCKRGCQCKPGFYRSHDGRCIDAVSCAMCGYGEQWVHFDEVEFMMDDGSSTSYHSREGQFEITCEDALYGIIRAEWGSGRPVISSGCYCASGYYRGIDGICVSKDSCEACGKNEIWEACGSSSCWEYTCDDVGIPFEELRKRPCTLDCRQGCKCSPGFYREETILGECVSAGFCTMLMNEETADDDMDDYYDVKDVEDIDGEMDNTDYERKGIDDTDVSQEIGDDVNDSEVLGNATNDKKESDD